MKPSLAYFALLLFPTLSGATQPPNFVLVYVDDLGWAETSVEMIQGRSDTRRIITGP